jgi:hypothetical protein
VPEPWHGFDQLLASFRTVLNICVRIQKYKGCSNETYLVMFCPLKKGLNGCRPGSYEDDKSSVVPTGAEHRELLCRQGPSPGASVGSLPQFRWATQVGLEVVL